MLFGLHKYSIHKPINCLGPLTNITHYSPHIIQLGFSQKYSPYCYHIEPQNYIISIKSPKALTLWENPKSPT